MAGQNWRKNKKGFMVNPEGKTAKQVRAEKKSMGKKENTIKSFERKETRRKKQEKLEIETNRTLLENQLIRDKTKNDKVSMQRQELGLRQTSRQALNKHSLDGTPNEQNKINKTDKPLGLSKTEKKRLAKNQISNFQRKKQG